MGFNWYFSHRFDKLFSDLIRKRKNEKEGMRKIPSPAAARSHPVTGRCSLRPRLIRHCLALSEIDPDRSDNKRINEFNDILKDRRPEFYQSTYGSQ